MSDKRPIGYYIRTFKAKAPEGYEYAWKTFYERRNSTLACAFKSLYLSPALIKRAEEQGYRPVDDVVPYIGIPPNTDGYFADDVAVLCIRPIPKWQSPGVDSFRDKLHEWAMKMAIKPEGQRIADVAQELDRMTDGMYTGCDKQYWANIMENMEVNLAKAEEAEKAKEAIEETEHQILKDAVGFIMEHNRHGHFNDAAEEEADRFVEKYRAHLNEMGYRRF